MTKNSQNPETLSLHAGHRADPTTGSVAVPIYQTTSYQFKNTEHAANLFGLKEFGNIYSRLGNPTVAILENRLAALEGGAAALCLSSGTSAVMYSIINICKKGDNIVTSTQLYGGTYTMFSNILPDFGITAKKIDLTDLDLLESSIDSKTKAIFCETITNPGLVVADISAIADIAHSKGIPLIVDNTVATPYLINPISLGADVVVHSMTKFIGGHGNSIGGIIVDGGKFDYGESSRFKNFVDPDPSYHGLEYWPALGHGSYIIKARVQLLRDLGSSVTPQNAFNFLQGLETLSIRMERHFENAIKVAEFLSKHDQVERVQFAGLSDSPWHERAKTYGNGKGYGSVPAFIIKGGAKAGEKFVNSLQLHSHVANIGDVRSLVIHPASTTHSQLTAEEQRSTGVESGLVRLSVGLETIDDIIDDLEYGFSCVKNI